MTDKSDAATPPEGAREVDPAAGRRAFLCRAIGAGGVVVGAAILGPPLVVFVSPALSAGDADGGPAPWLDLGAAVHFEVGAAPRRVVLRQDTRDAWLAKPNAPLGTIYVQRPAEETFLVHSAICTHLGCTVSARDDGFYCPCHGAVFATDGSLGQSEGKKNPALRGLDTLAWRLTPGTDRLEVQWQRFELDMAEKRPLHAGSAT